MKKITIELTKLLIIGTWLKLALLCGITVIYDANGHPDYNAINEQLTESYEQ